MVAELVGAKPCHVVLPTSTQPSGPS